MTKLDYFLDEELPLLLRDLKKEIEDGRIVVCVDERKLSPIVAAARKKSSQDFRWLTAQAAKALDLSFDDTHRLNQASYDPTHPLYKRLAKALRLTESTPPFSPTSSDPVTN